MRDSLLSATEKTGGAITRTVGVRLVGRHVFDRAVAAGLLVRVFPGTYVLSGRHEDRDVLRRAALAYRRDSLMRRPTAGRKAPALSHLDALDVWQLPLAPGGCTGPVHVTEGLGPLPRVPGIEVHRRRDFASLSTFEHVRSGLVVVSKEQAIVESWPLLPERDRRAPLIVGLRDRHVLAHAVLVALDRQPTTAGASLMRRIVGLVEAGNHSELEMWGHAHVFSDRRLPPSRPQHPVRLRSGQKVYLDRYFEEEMVDVELDGAAYHGRPGQRERDLRRDAALAALGIQAVRFSHPRLHDDPGGAVEELLDVLAVRRRQFGLDRLR